MFGYLGNFIRKWVIFCRPNKNQQILPHTHFFSTTITVHPVH